MPCRSTIIAIHPGALGDCILFGRLLWDLNAPVTLVTGGTKGRLLAGMGAVDRALDFDALPMHEVFSDTPPPECRLPELLGTHARLISCFAGGNRLAELRLAALCGAESAAFLPVRPPDNFGGHLLDLWADLLGCDVPGSAPWSIPDDWRAKSERALRELGVDPSGDYFVVHPGAGGERKCWPLERYVELGERLGGVVFVAGPVEADRWAPDRMRMLGASFPLLVCPELGTLAGVLAGARGFVGNDSGVAHLSAAAGTPTVTLFGQTSPEHFAPRGDAVRTLTASPIDRITSRQVLEALDCLRR